MSRRIAAREELDHPGNIVDILPNASLSKLFESNPRAAQSFAAPKRNGRKNSRMSSTSSSGSSRAAKWPPFGITRVAAQIEGALDPFLGRRRGEIGGEGGERRRRLHAPAVGQGARLLLGDAAIEPGRRARGAGQPIDHDVVEQQIHREAVERIAAAVAPVAELLDDPGGQPDRRIGERDAQRLRPRRLDALVGGLLVALGPDLAEPFLLGGAELVVLADRCRVAARSC